MVNNYFMLIIMLLTLQAALKSRTLFWYKENAKHQRAMPGYLRNLGLTLMMVQAFKRTPQVAYITRIHSQLLLGLLALQHLLQLVENSMPIQTTVKG